MWGIKSKTQPEKIVPVSAKPKKPLPDAVLEARKTPSRNMVDIHFLHIGKCAGSQVGRIARQINQDPDGHRIIKHHHDVYLRHLHKKADYFFSIRHPISRFSSGFYSRKRKGAPKLHIEWSPDDTFAFETFEHANDLAEALFEKTDLGHKAWAAMKSIRHTAQNQSDWFYCRGSFLFTRPPIWILRQENFDANLTTFFDRAKLDLGDCKIKISSDPKAAHANNYTDIPPLSDKAREKLSLWYAQGIAFYDMCEVWMMQDLKAPTT
ncbi:MAG: hypothetical protein ACI84R_001031 [Candidatus Azotimanducaceae bacterium]|jgi:hypothetical protein